VKSARNVVIVTGSDIVALLLGTADSTSGHSSPTMVSSSGTNQASRRPNERTPTSSPLMCPPPSSDTRLALYGENSTLTQENPWPPTTRI
jgi:hypothetical protein